MSNNDPIVIKLQHPVTYTASKFEGGGERRVTEVSIPRRLKAKHLRAIDKEKGEVGQSLALIAAITGLPKEAVDELDAEDLAAIQEQVPLDLPQATGATPSA